MCIMILVRPRQVVEKRPYISQQLCYSVQTFDTTIGFELYVHISEKSE